MRQNIQGSIQEKALRPEQVIFINEEMVERARQLFNENKQLQAEVKRLQAIEHQSERIRKLRAALATVSWADTLEEAQQAASEALKDV